MIPRQYACPLGRYADLAATAAQAARDTMPLPATHRNHWWVEGGPYRPRRNSLPRLEPLCGASGWWAPPDMRKELRTQTPQGVTCKHCLAHLRCRAGDAGDTDRALLAVQGVTPEHTGWLVGPVERTACMHHPEARVLYRWRWKIPAAGQSSVSSLETTGTTDLAEGCHLCNPKAESSPQTRNLRKLTDLFSGHIARNR